MRLFKCITGLLFETPLAVNVLNAPKNFWNLQKITFTLLFLHSEHNWVRKSYFHWDHRFQDCLITRWLETTSTLLVIERIYVCQCKWNSPKMDKPFALFCLRFWNLNEISNVLKKNERHRSNVSEVIDS